MKRIWYLAYFLVWCCSSAVSGQSNVLFNHLSIFDYLLYSVITCDIIPIQIHIESMKSIGINAGDPHVHEIH